MDSISKRLREIDKEIAELYREKRILENEQQEYWRKIGYTDSLTANAEENFETIYGY